MITSLELEYLVAARIGAGQPHGVGVSLRAGADEAHLLGAGHGVDDFCGEANAVLVVGEECRALGGLRLYHLDDLGMCLADMIGPDPRR